MTVGSTLVRPLGLALLVLLVASACDIDVGRLLVPCAERRHTSGIVLVCPDDVKAWAAASEETKRAFGSAEELAEAHPDAFGYPSPDFATGSLVLRIVRPDGETIARAWIASGADLATPKGTRALARPEVPVRLEAAARSVAQLRRVQDDIGPTLAALPDAGLIYMSAPDFRRNAVRYVVDHESDGLLRALAARYGTEALVVEITPKPGYVGY